MTKSILAKPIYFFFLFFFRCVGKGGMHRKQRNKKKTKGPSCLYVRDQNDAATTQDLLNPKVQLFGSTYVCWADPLLPPIQ